MIIKNDFEKKFNNGIIDKPMTPGYWLKETPQYKNITRIEMTCGGGIGGSHWYEYVNEIPLKEIKPNQMLTIITIDGEEKLINTNYVVSVDNSYQIVDIFYHSDNHCFEIGDYNYRYMSKRNENYELEDEYIN